MNCQGAFYSIWSVDSFRALVCLGPSAEAYKAPCRSWYRSRVIRTRSGLQWLIVTCTPGRLFRNSNFALPSQDEFRAALDSLRSAIHAHFPHLGEDWDKAAKLIRVDLATQMQGLDAAKLLPSLARAIEMQSMRPALSMSDGVYTHDFRGKNASSLSGLAYLKTNGPTANQALRFEVRFRRSSIKHRCAESWLSNALNVVRVLQPVSLAFWQRYIRWMRQVPVDIELGADSNDEDARELLESLSEAGLDAFGPCSLHSQDDLRWLRKLIAKKQGGILHHVSPCTRKLLVAFGIPDDASAPLKSINEEGAAISAPRSEICAPQTKIDSRGSFPLLLSLLLSRNQSLAFGSNLNLKSGCRSRIRTYDPLINSQLLYLLSYAATRDTIIPLSIGAMSHGT